MASNKVIGIDLGTTNSVVSIMEGNEPKVLINQQGARTTPSVVAFTDKGERLVGQPARHQQVTNPKNTIFSAKRFMGRRHDEVASEEKIVAYEVTGGATDLVKIKVHDKEYTPQEISAMILGNLKKTAEDYLGEEITRAVVTVPAYFNDSQRTATKEAGEIAGLTVERIINEPTAAALAYGLDTNKTGKVAVFDFGGGTFDISILDIGDGVFEVLATNGDTHLGGDDLDEILINYLADEFKRTEGIDLRNDAMALQRLKEAAEKAKCELSTAMEANINLPFITATADGPKHLTMTLTRAKFEQLASDLLERLAGPCRSCLKDAKLASGEVDEVILVGGSSRMPRVREIVKTIFGKEPNKSVNPDEVVAIGAGIQGAILTGDVEEQMVLLDVTPLSLGVETYGGVTTHMIERNTTIPTEKSEVYSTAADNQTEVTIHVLQGEREFAKDNRSLGQFNLQGIPAAPRGVPQIEVKFSIDANGILHVTAKDKGTGKEQTIQIQGSSGLDENEINKMREDAEAHAEDDKKRRELVDTKNQGDSQAYQMEKQLKDLGEKISAEDRSNVESAISALKDTLKNDDVDAIKAAMETLNGASHKIAEAMYAQASDEGTTDQPTGDVGAPDDKGDDDGDVIDAEYEVKE
ncbi:MAG: molecular chaperone DnaK [Phycisphaerales bacterium]|jgi:molecular chaperone DnaK|nr:molecular chaperone DnaK [Phycisphaerales bacterium]MBT7170904.1 molecular chaperone DnaK [Phycisphaerales bacterium]